VQARDLKGGKASCARHLGFGCYLAEKGASWFWGRPGTGRAWKGEAVLAAREDSKPGEADGKQWPEQAGGGGGGGVGMAEGGTANGGRRG
jgi:hypothetical protein